MAAPSSSGAIWSADAATAIGTAWAVRRACTWRRWVVDSAAVYRYTPDVGATHAPLGGQHAERAAHLDTHSARHISPAEYPGRLCVKHPSALHHHAAAREPHT